MYIYLSNLLIRHESKICTCGSLLWGGGQKRDTETERERETVDILIKVPTAFICSFCHRISRRTSDVKTGEVLVPNCCCQTSIPPRLNISYSPGSGQGLINYAAAQK